MIANEQTLQDVDGGQVIYHTISAPQPGFTWSDGGRMPWTEAEELDDLWHAGLIDTLPAQNVAERIDHRRRVELTPDGYSVLSERAA